MSNLFTLAISNDKQIENFIQNEVSEKSNEFLEYKEKPNEINELLYTNKENNNLSEKLIDNKKSIVSTEGRRTRMSKIFGPMEAGSIRGSIFNMLILTLGSGLLSLPGYVDHVSMLMATILIIVIALLVWWSLLLLSKVCEKNGTYNYSHLLKKLYGKKLSNLYDGIVIVYSFGIIILYQVIIRKLIGESIFYLYYYKDYKDFDDFNDNSNWNSFLWRYCLPFFILIIIYPLCLIKDVAKLRFVSFFGIITILFLIFLIFFQSFSYIKHNVKNNGRKKITDLYNFYNIKKGFSSNLHTFQMISSIYFATCVHIGTIPIFNTLKNNIRRRMYKVVRRTIVIDIFIFVVITNLGYLTCPKDTPSLIIERPSKNPNKADVAMCIGRLALVLTFIMKIPNCYATLRITLFDKLWKTTKITNFKNYILTFIVIFFCYIVSVLYTEINGYIKLMGGICSTLVGFIFPGLLYTKSNERPKWHWKNVATIAFFIFLASFGFIDSIHTIKDIINPSDD